MIGDDEVPGGLSYPKPSKITDPSALFIRDPDDGGKLKSAADAFYRKGEYATAVPLDEYGFVPPQKTYVPDAKEGFDAVERRREAEVERQAKADHDCLSRKLNMSAREVADLATNLPSHRRKVKEYSFKNGPARYEGEMRGEARKGIGVMKYADQSMYMGEWDNDMKEGKGVMRFIDGDIYEGTFKSNLMEGSNCMLRYNDGGLYVGEYRGNKKEGKGRYTWPDGAVYEGEFRAGNFNGIGQCRWPDGRSYIGEYREDRIEGRGSMTYSDGSTYVGDWKHGNRYGYGVYTNQEGVYEGEYIDDYKEGLGVFTWPKSGFVYEGQFKRGFREGRGIMTYPGKTQENGLWRGDKFLMACVCHLQPSNCTCFG